MEFLKKALNYAEEFPQLSEEIFTPSTVDSVMKVLPDILFHKIRDSKEYDGNPSSNRVSLLKIQLNKILEIMEIEQGKAIDDVDHHEMLKEHQVAFSSVNSAKSPPSP